MAGTLQDALADVANRLQVLKEAATQQEVGSGTDAQQLVAIKNLAQELEALLKPQATIPSIAAGTENAVQRDAAQAHDAQQPGPAGKPVPATPHEHRRAPDGGPFMHSRGAEAPTPAGGRPATTPLAAEVLASLGACPPGSRQDLGNVPPTAQANAAAKVLKELFSGVDHAAGKVGSFPPPHQQQQPAQPAMSPALAALFRDGQFLAPPVPLHTNAASAAAAAAAAAAPTMPLSRRHAGNAALLSLSQAGPHREQRPCNCKRSMCLKMYCECFAAGGFCAPSCSCVNCCNTPADVTAVAAARDVVLAKNPRAFEAKVTATAGHRRGCRCKRSRCLKKYCECFHAGALCNPAICQCEDCRNTDGNDFMVPLLGKGQLLPPMPLPNWTGTAPDILAAFQAPALTAFAAAMPALDGSDSQAGSDLRGSEGMGAFSLTLPTASDPLGSRLAGASPSLALDFSASASLMPAFPQPEFGIAVVPPRELGTGPATHNAAAGRSEQHMEESMADAAYSPAALPPSALMPNGAALVQCARGAHPPSAVTSHLSDMAGPAVDSEMHDTATSPAPVAITHLAARCLGASVVTATLTGGSAGLPPLPGSRVRSRATSPPSQGSADENGGDSTNTGVTQRGKRPKRAASGGVLGAVAAEAAQWGLDASSPPLKRCNSLPLTGLETSKPGRGAKVSDRVALLKRALAGDSAVQLTKATDMAAVLDACPLASDDCLMAAPSAEDADAISALFELSSSLC